MLPYPEVNLPLPILLHALGLLFIGLRLTFRPAPAPAPSSSMLGLSCLAIALSYLSTSYMPVSQNVFLHASVPVRMILGSVAALKVAMGAGTDATAYTVVAAYDGLGGVLLGWYLGRWDGRLDQF